MLPKIVQDRIDKFFSFADIICDIQRLRGIEYKVSYIYAGQPYSSVIKVRSYKDPKPRL